MEKVHQFNYKKNRLQQIKGFYYAARFRSISEAARVMNLTQSTVTLQIQSLERDLNLKLFSRDSKPLSLTPDGEDFYKTACPIMQEFESIVEKFLKQREESEPKKIDIAVHHIAISHLMPQVIATFKKSYPESKIVVRNVSTNEAIEKLKNDKIDLAFFPNPINNPEIKYIETTSYNPILILNKNHPLADKPIENLKDLKVFDLIRIDSSLITLPLFEEAVKTHKLRGSVEFENGNWEMLKHFVKETDFAAVVSSFCLNENDGDLVSKELTKFFPQMNYAIMHKKGKILNPLIKDFIKIIKDTLEGRKNF